MLKISNVETFYGKIQALRGVDLDVNDGEIVSLIGCKPEEVILASAKTGEGMNVLVEELIKKLNVEESVFYTSERVYGNIEKTVKTLSASSNEKDFYEINAQNARDALILLKEIYGDFDNEKILDQIFQKFCIGK